MISFHNNTSGNILRINTNYKPKNDNSYVNTNIETNENNYDLEFRKSNIDIVKNKIGLSKKNNLLSLLHKRQSIQVGKPILIRSWK